MRNHKAKQIAGCTTKVDGDYYRHECTRCDHVWYSRKEHPGTCASKSCLSPYWDRERVVHI